MPETDDATLMSEALTDLVFHAIERALVAASAANPFIPVLTVEGAEGRREAILAGSIDGSPVEGVPHEIAALNAAKNALKATAPSVTRYVFTSDQALTLENKKWDVILVEAGERDEQQGVTLVQRYKRGFFSKRVTPVGDPAFIERGKNFFST